MLSLGFELAHIGINADNEKEAEEAADLICMFFGFDKKVGNSSIFAGKSFEIMKSPYLGKNGHIAIAVNNIDRGIAYLKAKGIGMKQDTAKEKNGKLIAVYLDREIAGFAIHLLQK